jgi:hypothetical protein
MEEIMNNSSLEQTFYEDGEVKVTNLRAIIGSKTYAISNVFSVSLSRKDPSGCLPLIVLFLGICAGIGSFYEFYNKDIVDAIVFFILGVVFIILSIRAMRSLKSTYFIQINSASGEINALGSQDEVYIRKIIDAINQAIVQKG